ncbi:MAG: sigma-70 family RNA polymerase sigma factor [Thermoguttaceae bacterium]|nr:sigma-70 family RNA polymerase sigma factor [Thermoguttaceae bacterium]
MASSKKKADRSDGSESRETPILSLMDVYREEIKKTPLLTRAEEHDLALEVAGGSAEARDKMIRANLRLVITIARSYADRGLPLEDLIEEGNLGLIRAVEKFDPNRGTRFSTCATDWIKQAIRRALNNGAKTIRIPPYMVGILSKWRKAESYLTEKLGRVPSREEVLKILGIPRKKMKTIGRAFMVYNLTRQTDQNESGDALGETIRDERTRTPDEEMISHDNLRFLTEQLGKMNPRDAEIIKMHYGVGGYSQKTFKEIGEKFKLTHERIRQIENDVLDRLWRLFDGRSCSD